MAGAGDGVASAVLSVTGGSAVVTVDGDLDLNTVRPLRGDLIALCGAGVHHIVVDLRCCPFLDSSAAAMLLHVRRRCRTAGGDLVLRAPSRQATRFLAVSGLARCLPVEPAAG